MNRDARLIALALFLWGLGEGLFLRIQPLHIERLGADPVQLGGAISAAGAARALVFFPAGVLADRLPRKPLILGAWIIGPIAALLMGIAQSWRGLIPGIVLYGLSAYCIPVINAYLALATAGVHVERTFTTVYAIHTVGGIVSPALGGWLAGVAGYSAVYFVAASLFALSALAAVQLSAQPVPAQRMRRTRLGAVASWRFGSFAGLVLLAFTAMYLGFPLAPNFLAQVRGLDVTQVGLLGSLQALGMSVLGLLLGRVGSGRRGRGLQVGQAIVWASTFLLLVSPAFPLVGLAFVLRGAYQGCRALVQARASRFGSEGERGLLLGATETVIATAQFFAPYSAGWLYAAAPRLPLQTSLAAVPVSMLLTWVVAGGRRSAARSSTDGGRSVGSAP